MTALKQYARLESTGLWRATAEAQRREVGVVFGDATLVIADSVGRPLTHWSMPAMHRVNPGVLPAIYSPDAAGDETLELSDDLIVDAIDKVLRSVARATPRPGRLRNAGIALTLAVILGIGVFWMPGALLRQTLAVIPAVKRSEIGATLLGHIQRLTNPTCRDPLGTQALARLNTRLFGADAGQIVVIPDGPDGVLNQVLDLPGGIVVLSQSLVEQSDEPAILAGAILARPCCGHYAVPGRRGESARPRCVRSCHRCRLPALRAARRGQVGWPDRVPRGRPLDVGNPGYGPEGGQHEAGSCQ